MEFIWYENHLGKRLCLSEKPYKLLDIDDLYTISREYTESNGRITGFKQKIITKTLELDVLSTKDRDWKNSAEELRELLESDIDEPGKLYIGDYYIVCCIYLMNPQKVNLRSPYVTCKLTLVSDMPLWIKHHSKVFLSTEVPAAQSSIKRYPYTYPYRYRSRSGGSFIYNPFAYAAHYQIIVYGSVRNPAITIGNHLYQVNTDVGDNERLVIDYSNTRNRTITRYLMNGEEINEFNNRNKQNSVFELIKPGKQAVNWSGEFSFDIILIEERSQPKWI